MERISFSSRYYAPFNVLKDKLDALKFFNLVYNDDKNTYSLPYLYGNYKNELEPISISNKVISSITEFLDENLFSLEEKKLLLSELIPYATNLGAKTIDSLTKKLTNFEGASEKQKEYLIECEKTVSSLKQISNLVDDKLSELYNAITQEKAPISAKLISNNNKSQITNMQTNPKVFISYAWESDDLKDWVKNLAIELRNNGIDAKLDQWEVVPGDQMPHFMEKSVRENDYVVLICSPKYKQKSENRIGGVGYEGDIMTAEVLQNSNHRKFIPILQSGDKDISIPSWLRGKYFIDLSNDSHFQKNFEDLITTILNARETAPKIGQIPTRFQNQVTNVADIQKTEEDENIRIKGIIVDEVSQPTNDGTRGSGLYKIPFELNRAPSSQWIELFINSFNSPPEFTMMHRPGIASVYSNRIYLNGTTIEEVERYHKKTLKLAVDVANKFYSEIQLKKKQKEEEDIRQREQHKKNVDDISRRISFDD